MKKTMTLLALIFLFGVRAYGASDALEVVTPGKSQTFTLQNLKSKLKVHTVKIHDPVYGKEKAYDAFALGDILSLAGADSSQGDQLVFTAVDGYAPNTGLSFAHKHHPFLAFEEHGRSPGEFEKVRQGKAFLSPAPYYLIWSEGKELATTAPWPYQLVKIELVDLARKYAKIVPAGLKKKADAYTGFLLFTNHCIRCHSVNLEGGTVGPELNSPRNVTEYWKADVLPRFIHDAGRFRFRSKMPAFPELNKKQIQQILAYLHYMKDFKIKKP